MPLIALRAAFSTWRGRVGVMIVVLVAIVECANAVTNHLGFATALVLAIVAAPIACVIGAGIPIALRKRGLVASAGDVAASASLYALALVCIGTVIALVSGLMGHSCEPARGALFVLLLPVPGVLLAALVGVALGALLVRRGIATTLAALVFPAFVLWSLLRFYASPAIFAYDPFFGYFPGALYDETIALTSTLVTYRLGTLGWIVAIASAIHLWWNAERGCFERRAVRGPAAMALAGGVAVGLGVFVAGPALGHRRDAHDITRALGGRVDGQRCTVVYARTIPGLEALLTRDDCDVRIAQLESFFDVHVSQRVTVFLFVDADQKQQLMGAGETYIAKPWRHEVYLQRGGFPHPVLAHELAHVVAGEMGAWPFRVTSQWGVLPMPGIVEGAAVAAAWEGESDATPHEWTRAMIEAHLAPSMASLTGLGFFGEGAGSAYTAAGSFVRWLIDTRGAQRFHALYRTGDFGAAYGRSLADLEGTWRAFLGTIVVPERLLARARTRFRRASLFARVCPNETAELLDHATARLAVGDVGAARDALRDVVRNDPTNVHARTALAEASVRLGDIADATRVVDAAARDLGPAAAVRLRARMGDVVWRWHDADAARAIFAPLDADLLDEDEARTLEVKRWALGLVGVPPDPDYAVAVRDLLAGRGPREPDALAASVRLVLQFRVGPRGEPVEPMAAYLIARQLATRERPSDAASLLAGVDPAFLPTPRIRAEAVRLHAVSLYLIGRSAEARALFESLADDPTRPLGARDTARDWIDRIRRAPMSDAIRDAPSH